MGCRIATIYRYFPDKLAVVSQLAQRIVSEWGREFASLEEDLKSAGDLRLVWPNMAKRFVAVLEHNPHASAVRKAMQAVPELRAIDQDDNRQLAANLGALLQTQFPSLTKARATSVARVLIESIVSVVDLAMSSPKAESKRLRAELEAMQLAYINHLYASQDGKPEG